MILDLDAIAALDLRPDDVLVLTLAHLPDEAEAEELVAELARVVPDHRTLILGPGCSLEVLRPEPTGATGTTPTGGGVAP